MALDWDQLTKELAKKSTFETAVQRACKHCAAQADAGLSADDQRQLHALARRCGVLLRSRYSSPVFWRQGCELFTAAQPLLQAEGHAADVAALAQEAQQFLAAADGDAPSSSGAAAAPPATAERLRPRQSFLFEGQLSAEPDHSHGPARLYMMAQALHAAAGGNPPPAGAPDAAVPPEAADINQHLGSLLAALAGEGLWETDLLGDDFSFEDVLPAARPASKAALRRLKRLRVSGEVLAELGADVACPVCMERFLEGDEVQVMPCSGKHCFHPPCLAPWLAANNSCPMCRHELPTDDTAYEQHKAREAAAAEERRGAENALSHSEFLYI